MPKTKDWGSPYGKPDRPQPMRASRRVLVPVPYSEAYLTDHGYLAIRTGIRAVEKFEPLKVDSIERLWQRAQEREAREKEQRRVLQTYGADAW